MYDHHGHVPQLESTRPYRLVHFGDNIFSITNLNRFVFKFVLIKIAIF